MSLRRLPRRSRSPLLVRCALLCVLAISLLTAALGRARAETQACSNLGISMDIELLLPDGDGNFIEASEQDMKEFFNLAHCTCDLYATGGEEFGVKLHLVNAPGTLSPEEVQIWVGPSCSSAQDLQARQEQCEEIASYDDVESFRTPETIHVSTATFMFPNSDACGFEEKTHTVYALIDDDNENDSIFTCEFSVDASFDTKPPPAPVDPAASEGEGAVFVDWEPPTERQEDVEYYQFLCERVDGQDMGDGFPSDDPEYETSNMLCGVDDGTGLTYSAPWSPPADRAEDGGIDDAGPEPDAGPTVDSGPPPDAAPLQGMDALDPSFICGTAAGTETSKRIEGLLNGVEYRVGMVVVDEAKNVTAVSLGTVTPAEVTDFWEDYHDAGGSADGGVCLINSTYGGNHPFTNTLRAFRDRTLARYGFGRALIDWYYAHLAPLAPYVEANPVLRVLVGVLLLPLVAFAAFWVYTGTLVKLLVLLALVALWKRRRSRRGRTAGRTRALAAAAAAAALLCLSANASAQGFDPYWDKFDAIEDEFPQHGPEHVAWNLEMKLGPYLPNIDAEFDLAPGEVGPYEAVFRNKKAIMGILELQRFFLYPAGELGVTASVGFMGRSANSFKTGPDGEPLIDPDTGKYERAPGDKTRFRMIPSSVGAVYRFTKLDDELHIPVVPYGKLGLSYYLWWIRKPNGDLATVQTDESCTENCSTDRALGASIGWQATIGLSIRAERIDRQAGFNLRNEMNIEHAGFFGELTYASVDHFGANGRLNVGDFTWFAGINFEF